MQISNFASIWFISLFISIFATGILEMRWSGVGTSDVAFFLEYGCATATNCLLSYKQVDIVYHRVTCVDMHSFVDISYTTLWRVADRRVL